MTTTFPFLKTVYEGWESHQQALMSAVTPLTSEQLAWRLAPNLCTVNELIAHIAGARLWWFYKMSAPGSAALARQIAPWASETFNAGDSNKLNRWMEANVQWEETLTKIPGESLKWLESRILFRLDPKKIALQREENAGSDPFSRRGPFLNEGWESVSWYRKSYDRIS